MSIAPYHLGESSQTKARKQGRRSDQLLLRRSSRLLSSCKRKAKQSLLRLPQDEKKKFSSYLPFGNDQRHYTGKLQLIGPRMQQRKGNAVVTWAWIDVAAGCLPPESRPPLLISP